MRRKGSREFERKRMKRERERKAAEKPRRWNEGMKEETTMKKELLNQGEISAREERECHLE